MAKIHGKETVVTVDGDDLSTYTNTSEINRTMATHDVTGYGADANAFSSGLLNGTFTMGGVYDSESSAGPRAVLRPLLVAGAAVTVVRRPEGTGSGLPQDSFSAILSSYVESNPVAEMVAWTAEFQISGNVTSTAQ
ncbi:MAG TPA: hypothetical protein VF082_12700 [Jiangellaceae bacterium]